MKNITVLIIAGLLIFLIACQKTELAVEVKEENKEQMQTNTATEPIKEAEVKVDEKQMQEPSQEIQEEKNEQLTKEEQEVYDTVTEECIYQETETGKHIIALKNNDESVCKQIEDKDMQELCIAEVQKNPEVCKNAAESKTCEAIITKKSSSCEKEDHYCLGLTTGDSKHCEQIEELELAADCFLYTELKTEEFTEQTVKERCKDESYLFMAIEQYENKKFCEWIKDDAVKTDCKNAFEVE